MTMKEKIMLHIKTIFKVTLSGIIANNISIASLFIDQSEIILTIDIALYAIILDIIIDGANLILDNFRIRVYTEMTNKKTGYDTLILDRKSKGYSTIILHLTIQGKKSKSDLLRLCIPQGLHIQPSKNFEYLDYDFKGNYYTIDISKLMMKDYNKNSLKRSIEFNVILEDEDTIMSDNIDLTKDKKYSLIKLKTVPLKVHS